MEEDAFGGKIDEIIDSIIGFLFERLPIIIIILVIIFVLWKIFQPEITING